MNLATAYWCVLIAALLPYVWVAVSKGSGERYDNRDPRGWTARQANPRVHRANAAQLNGYEASRRLRLALCWPNWRASRPIALPCWRCFLSCFASCMA